MNKIPYPDREKVYTQAIDTFGCDAQVVVAIEELSELQKELCKALRGNPAKAAIAEEMADVTIMLEQLRIIFDNEECVCHYMDSKVKRLAQRVKDAKSSLS